MSNVTATNTFDALLQVRVDEEHKTAIDALRRQERDLPSRAEMVRRLIERAGKRLESRK